MSFMKKKISTINFIIKIKSLSFEICIKGKFDIYIYIYYVRVCILSSWSLSSFVSLFMGKKISRAMVVFYWSLKIDLWLAHSWCWWGSCTYRNVWVWLWFMDWRGGFTLSKVYRLDRCFSTIAVPHLRSTNHGILKGAH